MEYKMTEFGNKMAPYLLSLLKERNPEVWRIVEQVIKEEILFSDWRDFQSFYLLGGK